MLCYAGLCLLAVGVFGWVQLNNLVRMCLHTLDGDEFYDKLLNLAVTLFGDSNCC